MANIPILCTLETPENLSFLWRFQSVLWNENICQKWVKNCKSQVSDPNIVQIFLL